MKDQPDISAEDKTKQVLKRWEEELGITYDKVQKMPLSKPYKARSSSWQVVLTGKTTVINGIIKTYADLHGLKSLDLPITLAAPTGRAARRMNELTQLPSATIHRHLGLNSEDDCDPRTISIGDSWLSSMSFLWLWYLVGQSTNFESISDSTQVVIVGDQDQLPLSRAWPGLGWPADWKTLPVSSDQNFSDNEDSTIVTLASQMRQGQLPADFTEKKADRSYFEANANHIPQMVLKIVSRCYKESGLLLRMCRF